MYNRFSDIESIDKDFNIFSKGRLSEDIVDNAVILEDFLIKRFEIELQNNAKRYSEMYEIRDFIVSLDSIHKKNHFHHRKESKKPNMSELIQRFSDWRLFSFENSFLSKNSEHSIKSKKIHWNISAGRMEDLSFKLNLNRLSYENLQLKIDFIIIPNSLKNYISNILYEKEHEEYRELNPIFNVPQRINYQGLLSNIVLQPKVGDFNFKWMYGENQELHAKIQSRYCLKCHERNKDSCNHGLKNKSENEYLTNPLDQTLHGCPLGQHISESIKLYELGKTLAALATIMINNPLVVLTGYRICNDCVKSCIFQKQTPVDIPSIETMILDTILNLRFGIELYILLTRWNPLNKERRLPKPYNNKKILIVGLGPAGISASYHLLRAGFEVIAIEATKIEPLKEEPINESIEYFTTPSLEQRKISGFGGVMEYGITSRWNKNYLTVAQIVLSRNEKFSYYDGVKFGANYEIDDAFKQDRFDHVVLATASNKQTIPVNSKLTPEMKLATDFLMSLQLGGAYKMQNEVFSSTLQLRLPAIVLGCGLTAVDTASEILNYYPRQVLKVSENIKKLKIKGIDFNKNLNEEELRLLKEFIEHAEYITNLNSQSEIYNFLEKLGGVKIIYYKNIQNSGAYKTNHEEFREALKKGVKFVENFDLNEVIRHENGMLRAIKSKSGEILEAKSIFYACGSTFNRDFFNKLGISEDKTMKFFHRLNGKNVKDICSTLIDEKISVIGDSNPQYKGSVVKAILSGRVASDEIESLF